MLNMLFASGRGQVPFSQNYKVARGNDHFSSLNGHIDVHLELDHSSGSGFESKSHLLSGLFNMKIKLPASKLPGVVTTFYMSELTSKGGLHDEIDFEFIGSNRPPYELNTNIYTKGVGVGEQKFHLWFDPSTYFHSYTILWNQYQVVFFVDNIPIRVFKNLGNRASYPTQGMQVEAIWAAKGWAGKINWSKAPFTAQHQGFDIDGCVMSNPSNPWKCDYTHGDAWAQIQSLNAAQIGAIPKCQDQVYDYCADRSRYPQPPPECQAPIGI
ncbi:hypothetical protein ACJRO7_008323 [Eucalyptus globulus]|uniref:Xyloglucan endotransglucosylase/hydrolase n=1 Tax=Eucalyptus globulus TaxID=34317 RepID=A0ABD3IQR0_EUCGL